jgi:hypothetical protein
LKQHYREVKDAFDFVAADRRDLIPGDAGKDQEHDAEEDPYRPHAPRGKRERRAALLGAERDSEAFGSGSAQRHFTAQSI